MHGSAQSYTTSISYLKDAPGVLEFTFVLKGMKRAAGSGEFSKRAPQYAVRVQGAGNAIVFDWENTPDDPGEAKSELEEEARRRIDARCTWVRQVEELVAQVSQWGKELGWETRKIEKHLDDSYVGKHVLPALLMQEETCRVLLEPVGRSAPGAEGVVDLYLMPAYDDIASLYFYNGQWNIHYFPPNAPATEDMRVTNGIALSRDSLRKVLEEMRNHAV